MLWLVIGALLHVRASDWCIMRCCCSGRHHIGWPPLVFARHGSGGSKYRTVQRTSCLNCMYSVNLSVWHDELMSDRCLIETLAHLVMYCHRPMLLIDALQ